MSIAQAIRIRVAANDLFSSEELRCWMAKENDLDLWAAVSDVLHKCFDRTDPQLEIDEECEFMTRYLLHCIHADVPTDEVPSGYEAAHELSDHLKHWAKMLPETKQVLSDAAQRITEAFLSADADEQDRLLNGAIEHALEAAAVRPFFQQWEHDPVLSEPWRLAMQWVAFFGDSGT